MFCCFLEMPLLHMLYEIKYILYEMKYLIETKIAINGLVQSACYLVRGFYDVTQKTGVRLIKSEGSIMFMFKKQIQGVAIQ